MVEINYVCSLGLLCHSSQLLKNNNLKKCSYPFDWIFSNCNTIIHCLKDNFKTFLDKSYYISISEKQCGHKYYNDIMFNHHNPLDNIDDYNYFKRCINRFNDLLRFEKHKLFIMTYINMSNMDENIKNEIINFNDQFLNYSYNYTLLVIFNISNKEKRYFNFTLHDNIHFLELHTLSNSNGIFFEDDNDNIYLNTIINSTYNFNNIN